MVQQNDALLSPQVWPFMLDGIFVGACATGAASALSC